MMLRCRTCFCAVASLVVGAPVTGAAPIVLVNWRRQTQQHPGDDGDNNAVNSTSSGGIAPPVWVNWPQITRRQTQLHPGDGGDNNTVNTTSSGGIAPQVWIPAVIVVLVLLGVFVLMWTRTNVLSRLWGMASRSRNAPSTTTREITATQLAGATNAGRTTTTTGTTRPVRAGRRTRRTPSQMSVTSLPVYMKEPGDQELVIFRGPEEMEDASDAIAEAREAEDADDMSDQQSVIMRESAIYNPAPIPASSQNLSLMSETSRRASAINVDETGNADSSTAELMPRSHTIQNVLTRESDYSRDSADSADSTRPLSEAPSESPPDYETEQGHNAIQNPPGLSSSPEPSSENASGFTTASLASSNATSNRRSVFRGFNLFNLGSSSNGLNSSTHSPIPTASSEEPRSSNLSASPPDARTSTTTRHVRHRSSQSGLGSGSTFSAPFRTLSRQRSTTTLRSTPSRPNLTSPSALSINSISISAPLSHTLMRTEIRYPRGGPTPEQIKLISSRESLGRFGVPYGRDAIEHAQNSRLELALDPPPAFESPADESGPSAARDEGEEMPEGHEDDDDLPSVDEPSSSSNTAQRSRSHSTDRRSSPERRQDGDSTIPPRLLVPLFM